MLEKYFLIIHEIIILQNGIKNQYQKSNIKIIKIIIVDISLLTYPSLFFTGGFIYVSDEEDDQNPLDPWSIVWYIGSFGGLVAFFLIVSCSEWCCRRGGRSLSVPYSQRNEVINGPVVTETPPPPYHLFAPPSYDSVNYGEITDKTSGEKVDIYVISVPLHRPVVQAPA